MGLVILIPLYHYSIYCIPLDYHENSNIISLNHLEIPFFHRNWAIWKTTDVSPMLLVRLALPNSPDPQYTMHVRQKKTTHWTKHIQKKSNAKMETSEILYPHPLFYFFCLHSTKKWAGPLTTVTLTATTVTAAPWPRAVELLRWASGAMDVGWCRIYQWPFQEPKLEVPTCTYHI